MKKSFVYLGLVSAPRGGVFVKVGKTDHPEKRVRRYNTHCPGGLNAMYAAEVESSAAAFAAEFRLLQDISAIHGATRVGGEWLWLPSSELDSAFTAFIEIAGEPFSVDVSRKRQIANFVQ